MGLLVGPSTGMQLAMIKEMKENKTLNQFRNKNGEVVITFIGGDTMYPYIDEYFSVLPTKHFKPERTLNK